MSPFIDRATCEPLRIFGRLEPRARRTDFGPALAASVADAAWFLARQWQMGEFHGEDAGSAVLAKLARRVTPVDAVQVGGGAFEAADGLPLEARVERLAADPPPTARAQLGRVALALLDEEAAAAGAAGYDPAHYRAVLRGAFGVTAPADPPPADAAATARARAESRARRLAAALAAGAVDGFALAAALPAAPASAAALPAALAAGIAPGHEPFVLRALERFRLTVAGLHPAPAQGWDDAALEYRAACTVPRDGGAVTLTVDEHVSGRLDWHAFDQGPVRTGTPAASATDVRSVIPTPAEFAGMPNPRWWQMEDAAVQLTGFRAQATDLAKIVVAEFALVYGNNWLVIPCRQPVGTLAEIEGIVVTDVFGRRTLIEAATGASTGTWTSWDLFSLSPRTPGAAAPLPQHLFLPPSLGHVLDGEPHEVVALVRDESADMVWAVERRIPDGAGAARDGTEAARREADALAAILPAPPPPDPAAPPLRWRLGTSVPANWIPFLPVHRPADTRAIRLQRGSMPRFLPGGPVPVRPRTTILRSGLRDDDTQAAPLFVDEEEVPRAGIQVRGALRRARRADGSVVVWHGRTVVSGRGEVDSGLRFDVVEPRVDRA